MDQYIDADIHTHITLILITLLGGEWGWEGEGVVRALLWELLHDSAA